MIDIDGLPVTRRWVARTLGIFFLIVVAFLVFGIHVPDLIDAWADQPSTEYLADPAVFWLVKFMDLGIVVPSLCLQGLAFSETGSGSSRSVTPDSAGPRCWALRLPVWPS
jgi:hypothetical protein